jgi:hypothetical protein
MDRRLEEHTAGKKRAVENKKFVHEHPVRVSTASLAPPLQALEFFAH